MKKERKGKIKFSKKVFPIQQQSELVVSSGFLKNARGMLPKQIFLIDQIIHNDSFPPAFSLNLRASKENSSPSYFQYYHHYYWSSSPITMRRYCYLVIIWSMEMEIGSSTNVEREAFPRDTQRVFSFAGFILLVVWSRRFQVVGIQARKRVAQIVSGRWRLSI